MSDRGHESNNIAFCTTASRAPPKPSQAVPRQQQRDALPHLVSRDSAPRQRDAAPHQSRSGEIADSADFARSWLSKGSNAQGSSSTASRRLGSLGNILSKQRINRDWEDAQAAKEEEVLEEGLEDQEKAEVDAVQPAEASDEEQNAVEIEAEEDVVPEEPRVKPRIRVDKSVRHKEKERGSVVSRLKQGDEEIVLERRSRTRSDNQHVQGKPKEKKPKATKPRVKAVQRDIFIPTMVTVGNFARLLKVKPDTLRRRMIRVGMDAEASYSHRERTVYQC